MSDTTNDPPSESNFKVPAYLCPCGYGSPEPYSFCGNLSGAVGKHVICPQCGRLTVFNDDFSRRELTLPELAALKVTPAWKGVEQIREMLERRRNSPFKAAFLENAPKLVEGALPRDTLVMLIRLFHMGWCEALRHCIDQGRSPQSVMPQTLSETDFLIRPDWAPDMSWTWWEKH